MVYCVDCKYFDFSQATKIYGHPCMIHGSCGYNWDYDCEDYKERSGSNVADDLN